jgi:hypothetical protein
LGDREEFSFGGLTRLVDGFNDASPSAEYLEVGGAAQSLLKFLFSGSCEDKVGVRIDKAREDYSISCEYLLGRSVLS